MERQGAQTLHNVSFQYSSTGNRTRQTDSVSGLVTNYAYDQANRLVNYNNGVATYRYNGDGLRMAKTRSGQAEERFTWDVGAGLPLLLQDANASYIYGPGGMVLEQVSNSGSVHYYHHDQLGSVRALTNSAGNVVNSYEYDAYGKVVSSTVGITNPFGYAGEYTDSESGLQYLRARYYDPQTQQFLSVDPMLASTEQAYAYAAGSPTNATDPTGKVVWFVPFLVAYAIGVAANMAMDVGVDAGAAYFTGDCNYDFGTSAGNAAGNWMNYVAIPGASQVGKAAKVASKLDDVISVGTPVYRLYGGTAGPWGRYWTRVDPRTVIDPRVSFGLPSEWPRYNSGNILRIGYIKDPTNIKITPGGAAPLHGNLGGLDEIFIPDPKNQVVRTAVEWMGLSPYK